MERHLIYKGESLWSDNVFLIKSMMFTYIFGDMNKINYETLN